MKSQSAFRNGSLSAAVAKRRLDLLSFFFLSVFFFVCFCLFRFLFFSRFSFFLRPSFFLQRERACVVFLFFGLFVRFFGHHNVENKNKLKKKKEQPFCRRSQKKTRYNSVRLLHSHALSRLDCNSVPPNGFKQV